MLGRRRGRNRPAPQDDLYPSSESDTESGSVKLVEGSPAGVSSAELVEPSTDSQVQPRTPTPIKKTSSDVATAHAELDSVLPPSPADRVVEEVENEAEIPSAVLAAAERPRPAPQVVASPVTVSEVNLEVAPDEPVTGPTPDPDSMAADAEATGTGAGEEAQAASGNPLPRVMAVANQKGGVGKTTTSVNLGAALAELGFRVLVIDLDPQGNATTGLGIDARNFELSMYDVMMRDASLEDCVEPTSMKNLFVAPATIALAGAEIELVPAFSRELKLKRSIESVLDDFDYVLIDCPPSLGLITVNALAAADEVLVPIQCEYYALEGLSQLMRNVHLVASNLNPQLDISTIVLTMYDARTKLADQVANEVRQHFGSKVCRSVIPRTVRLSEAPSFGQPITAFDPTSRGAIAYRELAKEVSGGAS